MKAFCLAFAFLSASLPALADEEYLASNAGETVSEQATGPGQFEWVVVEDSNGSGAPPAPGQQPPPAPARAALSQMRVEMQRVLADARRTDTNVERVRFDLHVSCEMRLGKSERQPPLENASMPWIWGAGEEKKQVLRESLEVCEVDYAEKVRVQPSAGTVTNRQARPEIQDFKVSFPVKD